MEIVAESKRLNAFVLGLKLILKVGGNSSTSTPEHYFENTPAGIPATEPVEDTFNSPSPTIQFDSFNKVHKKSKKKKKKKEKDHDKRDKKKKHRKVRHLILVQYIF